MGILRLFPILLVFIYLQADARPFYGSDVNDVAWFLVFTDTHVGCQFSCGDSDTENLDWATSEAWDVIDPAFVVNCGDLTDATNGGLIPKTQYDSEWESYRSILDKNGMSADIYLDIPGNHDAYFDEGLTHYLKYSVQGSTFNRTQHSYKVLAGSSVIHIIGIATPTMNGGSALSDNAALDDSEMAFIRQSFDDAAGADVHLVFGHHGIKWGGSNKVGEGGEEFRELMKTMGVAGYFWGHTHDFLSEYHDNTLFTNLASLSKSNDRNVGIVVIDHQGLSVRAFSPRDWPYVIVTAPLDTGLGGGNPNTYKVPANWTSAPVRAVVFAPEAPASVDFRLDSGEWTPMSQSREHVWSGTFDTTGLTPATHTIEVRAAPFNRTDTISFNVSETTCLNGIDDDEDGLTDFPEDPGCDNPADMDEFNVTIPEPELIPDVPEIVETSDGFDTALETDTSVGDDVFYAEEPDDAWADQSNNGEGVDGTDEGSVTDQSAHGETVLDTTASFNDATTRLDTASISAVADSGCSFGPRPGNDDSPVEFAILAMTLLVLIAFQRRRT